MSNYTVAIGYPVDGINRLVSQLYGAYRTLFRGRMDLSEKTPITGQLDWDIVEAPRVFLGEPGDGGYHLQDEAAFFTVTAPLSLSLQFQGGTPQTFTAELRAACTVTSIHDGTRWKVTPRIVSMHLSILPADPETESFLSTYVLPFMAELINDLISRKWNPPPMQFAGVDFSQPATFGCGFAGVGVAALASKGKTERPREVPLSDPSKSFICVDGELLTAVARAQKDSLHLTQALPPIDLYLCKISLTLELGVREVKATMHSAGAYLDFDLYGATVLKIEIPGSSSESRAEIIAHTRATAALYVDQDWIRIGHFLVEGEVSVEVRGLELPELLKWATEKISSAIATLVAPPISAFVSLLRLPVHTLPQWPIDQGGVKQVVHFTDVVIDYPRDSEGKQLARASGHVMLVKG